MKQSFTSLFMVALLLCWLPVDAQITTPRTASPAAKTMQTIGISTVTVKYSRPSVREREVWGKLVPYGWNKQGFGYGNDAPWRAGANENTVINFSHDATIGGKKIKAGSYGLFYVINEDNTGELILSTDTQSWGSFWYDAKNDAARIPIKIRDIAHTELLTYDFINPDKTSAELILSWEKKQFPAKIEFAVDDIVLANAAEELKGTTGFGPQGYSSAAQYALVNNTQLEQGVKWIDQALTQNRNFANLNVKANLLKKSGKNAEADILVKEATDIANEGELNIYGYQLLNQGNHDKAIEILTLNTQRHPSSANTWDSLGEAYYTKGDHKSAIKYFKKSLSLNPPANVKANSEKYLKELGVKNL